MCPAHFEAKHSRPVADISVRHDWNSTIKCLRAELCSKHNQNCRLAWRFSASKSMSSEIPLPISHIPPIWLVVLYNIGDSYKATSRKKQQSLLPVLRLQWVCRRIKCLIQNFVPRNLWEAIQVLNVCLYHSSLAGRVWKCAELDESEPINSRNIKKGCAQVGNMYHTRICRKKKKFPHKQGKKRSREMWTQIWIPSFSSL